MTHYALFAWYDVPTGGWGDFIGWVGIPAQLEELTRNSLWHHHQLVDIRRGVPSVVVQEWHYCSPDFNPPWVNKVSWNYEIGGSRQPEVQAVLVPEEGRWEYDRRSNR